WRKDPWPSCPSTPGETPARRAGGTGPAISGRTVRQCGHLAEFARLIVPDDWSGEPRWKRTLSISIPSRSFVGSRRNVTLRLRLSGSRRDAAAKYERFHL